MLGSGRIAQAVLAPRAHLLRGTRLLSTSRAAGARKAGASAPDRTSSTAFVKKKKATVKVPRSGTATSVNMSEANPRYYAPAPEVDLVDLDVSTASDGSVGKMVGLSGRLIDQGSFPGSLGADFKLFGRPALLYRKDTQDLVNRLLSHTGRGTAAPTTVLSGKAGSGKSVELFKVASVAASTNAIVLYVPSTIAWVDSSQPYAPLDNGMYAQLEVVLDLLQKVSQMNRVVLAQVPLGKELAIGKKKLAADSTLADLVDYGLQVPSLGHEVLEALLDIASSQTVVPFVIALDEVNTFWNRSQYRDQNDNVLPARRLRLVNALLPFFDGSKQVASGWVLGAVSYSNMRFMDKKFGERLSPPPKVHMANPMLARDTNVLAPAALPFAQHEVDRLTPAEAWALMGFYHQTSIARAPPTRPSVAKTWIMADGNPRDFFSGVTAFFY
ncbi:hypothetical protein GGF46_000674 [Coemansia sp. RSA 552]|nr:hypothetical protein GGF46_000674 [Coemansia sp. RSA 552]